MSMSEKQLTVEAQHEIKENLIAILGSIYTIKFRIATHNLVAGFVDECELDDDQFWGYFQSNLNLVCVIVSLFALVDNSSGQLLKRFVRILRKYNVYLFDESEIII